MTWVRAQIEFYLRGFIFSVRKNKGIYNKILTVIQKMDEKGLLGWEILAICGIFEHFSC